MLDRNSTERLALLERARPIRPNFFTLLELGDCYRDAGDAQRAHDCYREAAATSPAHAVTAYRRLDELCRRLGRPAEAKEWRRVMSRPRPHRRSGSEETDVPSAPGGVAAGPVWCVVANVANEIPYGPRGALTRRGTKHFPPGAKVYCVCRVSDVHVEVIGRHRGSHRYVKMILPEKALTDCKAKLVYSPYVIRALGTYWDGSAASKDRATEMAGRLAKPVNAGG
jgi:tetratricopeptide (TPR) repeat protein